MSNAPRWRREPYRVFFPLGLVLVWAGVSHWLLHGTGLLPEYRPVFHAIVQVQGFLLCFALGFLFTALPRFTGTAAPSPVEMSIGIGVPLGITLAAWFERFAESQWLWLLLVATVLRFAWRRRARVLLQSGAPTGFVWVPLAFVCGAFGSLLIGAYGLLGDAWYGLHELGRLLLLQGMFVGLVVGLGSTVLPLFTRGEQRADRLPRSVHLGVWIVLLGCLWIEHALSLRAGLLLRAALVCGMWIVGGLAHKPTLPGWHRRFAWIAAWMLPLGFALAASFPEQKKAGLHVAFIGGFALLALSVSLHVTLAHSGDEEHVRRNPWPVPVFGALLLASTGLRALVDFDPARFFVWIAVSAAVFLAGTATWATLVLPRLWRAGAGGADR